MKNQALDYSAGIPSGATVHADGYDGVLRYLRKTGHSSVHVLSAAEYADMTAHGVGVGLIYEDIDPARMAKGSSAGVSDAVWALQQARVCGIAAPRCIYFTADWDVQPNQYAAVCAYLDGAASVLDRAVVGLYGGYRVITQCGGASASWLWQTDAWSGGQLAAGIHIRQRVGTVFVDGIGCDVSDICQPDWGQHPAPVQPAPDPDPAPPAPKEYDDMTVFKPTTPGPYLLVIPGVGVTLLSGHNSTDNLAAQKVPFIQLDDGDFNRLKALVK